MRAQEAGVNAIVLHKNDLDIIEYVFSGSVTGGGVFQESQYDNVTDKWTILLTSTLSTVIDTTVTITYKGYMRDDMNGFYRSYYYENGAKVWMASTQLQQTEARRAFPCFDVRNFFFLLFN